MDTKTLLLFAACCAISSMARAQFFDSARVQVGTTGTVASKDYQPLWLVSNKFATLTDRKTDLSSHLQFTNLHRFGKAKADSLQPFSVRYGFDFYNNDHFGHTFFEEGFFKAGYRNWEFRAGRFEEITGDVDPALSSGSLGISGNALPIPKVGFAVTDYTNVPFTKGWLQFKGQFSHGWFGNDRYMKDAFLHEKILYMRLGKKKLKLYGGVQHFAEWGGRRGDLQLERSWKGFWDVVFVREADDGSVGTAVNGRLPNRPGDQRGLVELGFTWENEKLQLHGYHQTPFETGRDVDLRNVDKLIGLSFTAKNKKTFIKRVLLEVLSTKDMLSFVEQRDRQSFYNNGFYKTGWEYEGRIIGTPLFINRIRANKYFPAVLPYNWDAPNNTIFGNDNIIDNRITGAHLGVLYSILPKLNSKMLITFTRNYGTHAPRWFSPHKDQWYTLQQFIYSTTSGLSFTAGVGIDAGDLSHNTGFLFSVQKTISISKYESRF